MNRHLREVGGTVFEIDVMPFAIDGACFAQFYVAYVSRLEDQLLVPVRTSRGRREVYGPTEAWALQNACDVLDSGAWWTR